MQIEQEFATSDVSAACSRNFHCKISDCNVSLDGRTYGKRADYLLGPEELLFKVCRLGNWKLTKELLLFLSWSKLTSVVYESSLFSIKSFEDIINERVINNVYSFIWSRLKCQFQLLKEKRKFIHFCSRHINITGK